MLYSVTEKNFSIFIKFFCFLLPLMNHLLMSDIIQLFGSLSLLKTSIIDIGINWSSGKLPNFTEESCRLIFFLFVNITNFAMKLIY